MIKILVVDDHKMFVEGLESILSKEEDIQIVHRCHEGKDVFDEVLLEKIDIILLDINLPDMSGISVCERILKMNDRVKILVLSMHDEESYITAVLRSGALGYVLKNTGRKELLTAIRTVAGGRTYFSESITNTIMNNLMNQNRQSKTVEKETLKLTRREREVLDLIMAENTNQEIAGKLYISLKTVEAHRSNLLSKFSARNTAGLVKRAIEMDLV